MSGHSKWSKVKHQKEVTDAVKGKIFTKLSNAITIAVKDGGGVTDLDGNIKLRLAVEKARNANMPKEKIEKAIERAKATAGGGEVVQVQYEAFGPGGVGIIIEAVTDNRQRTVAEIKNIFERGGGVLAQNGAVVHLFGFVGQIIIAKGNKSFDEIMEASINCEAIDIEDLGDDVAIYTQHDMLHKIKEEISQLGFNVKSFELVYRPTTTIPIQDKGTAEKILHLLDSLEDLDDVQKVFANFDIPDEFLEG